MKRTSKFKAFFLAAVFMVCSHAFAGPTLLVNSDGKLYGARNVDVLGVLYDVRFTDGSCVSLYAGCRGDTFTFNWQVAYAASQALMMQVLVDGPKGNFDSDPSLTLGCESSDHCYSFIPTDISRYSYGMWFYSGYFPSNDRTPNSLLQVGSVSA